MGSLTREWEAGTLSKPVYIIAEAGINHNGSFAEATRLIDMAAMAEADAVKFQLYMPDRICRKDNPEYAILKRCSLPRDKFRLLSDYCKNIGIDFMCTAFDVPSANYLDTLNMRWMKVGSGQCNTEFLDSIAHLKTPLIVSTGMGSWPLTINNNIRVHMHCVSAYPCPLEHANMARIHPPITGFSDHTIGYEAAIMAVARGAKFIEKHITRDRSQDGPDHIMSADPQQFVEYVRAIRRAESMLGDGDHGVRACELKTIEQLKARL